MMCKIYTPMCASAYVVSSNIVYLGYEYRSMGRSALSTEIGPVILSGRKL